MKEEAMENRFDQLAKDLARGVTRREALRRLCGGLATATLASLGMGKAWSQSGTITTCATFCASIFPPGRDRVKCVSDASKGQGICFECGPAAPIEQQGRFCQTSSGPVCCASGEVCRGSFCVPNLSACSNPGTCTSPLLCFDQNGIQCQCTNTVDLGPFCLRLPAGTTCSQLVDCNTSKDCPDLNACAVDFCCGRKVCVPPCFE
jgi:hypothetical protein